MSDTLSRVFLLYSMSHLKNSGLKKGFPLFHLHLSQLYIVGKKDFLLYDGDMIHYQKNYLVIQQKYHLMSLY